MDPEAEQHYRSRAYRCHACAARAREERRFNGAKGADDAGLYFTVEPRV